MSKLTKDYVDALVEVCAKGPSGRTRQAQARWWGLVEAFRDDLMKHIDRRVKAAARVRP